jgi:hypothetical protein
VGYKVHITETCEDDLPHLIMHIETTPGPTADGATTPTIHAALQQRDLLPGTPIVDTGFLDAELLVASQEHYGVALPGPTRLDHHWQAREGTGFDAQHFQIDWSQQHAICPAGKISTGWMPLIDTRGNPIIQVRFASKDFAAVSRYLNVYAPRSATPGGRSPFGPSHHIRPCKRPGNGRPRMPFERSMPAAPASKARSRVGRGAHAYDGPATWASGGFISAIS